MPMYNYTCLDCGKESLLAMILKKHESINVTCPKCGSTKSAATLYVVCGPHDQEQLTACKNRYA